MKKSYQFIISLFLGLLSIVSPGCQLEIYKIPHNTGFYTDKDPAAFGNLTLYLNGEYKGPLPHSTSFIGCSGSTGLFILLDKGIYDCEVKDSSNIVIADVTIHIKKVENSVTSFAPGNNGNITISRSPGCTVIAFHD